MSNELQYYGYSSQTGLTVTAKIYNSAGAQVGSNVSTSEVGTSAIYIGNMPTASAGQYGVRFFDGENLLGQDFIYWTGLSESSLNPSESDKLLSLPSASDNIAAMNANPPAVNVDSVKRNTDLIPALL